LDGSQSRWPSDFPSAFTKACGFDLGCSDSEFRGSLFDEVDKQLGSTPEGAEDLREWYDTGLSNGIAPRFVALHIPKWTSFFVHQHPGIELVYLLRGSMHEIRLTEPRHIERRCVEPVAPFDLKDDSYQFERKLHVAQSGRWLANEVGSVHQSFTEEEDCVMIAIWPGRYTLFEEDQLPEGVFVPVSHSSQEGEWQQSYCHEERRLTAAT